jgi:hypothetical protein
MTTIPHIFNRANGSSRKGMTESAGGHAIGPTLCVHFTSDRAEYSLWFAEAAQESAVDLLDDAGMDIIWRRRPSGVLRGEVRCRGSVVCDAVILGEHDAGRTPPRETYRRDREMLSGEGIPRRCGEVLAWLPQRPLLCTLARGPALSPGMVRQVHRLLLEAAPSPACDPPAAACRPRPSQAAPVSSYWHGLGWARRALG